jgi:hypothetical protein
VTFLVRKCSRLKHSEDFKDQIRQAATQLKTHGDWNGVRNFKTIFERFGVSLATGYAILHADPQLRNSVRKCSRSKRSVETKQQIRQAAIQLKAHGYWNGIRDITTIFEHFGVSVSGGYAILHADPQSHSLVRKLQRRGKR